MLIHLNGRLVEEDQAVVSVFDRGFLFGDGLFESMRSYAGRVFRQRQHLDRLHRSAERVVLADLPPPAALATAIGELLAANRLEDARLRLTVTRGRGRPGDYVATESAPTIVISAAPFEGLEPGLFEQGVALAIAARRAVPADSLDPSVKSTSRITSVLARREAASQGAFEAVFLDATLRLTEGTASNLCLVVAGGLLTPESPGGILPGVTRAAVIETALAAGFPVSEQPLQRERLFSADEVFLTNSSWEVLPVTRVDGRPIGGGAPGPISRDLLARYRTLVRTECRRV